MKINVAKESGFCSGVARAIKIAKDSVEKYGKIYMLGDIVHNEHVIRELESLGIVTVDSLSQIFDNKYPILLRSHGTQVTVLEEINRRGFKTIDATCPLVKNIHKKAEEILKEGRKLIIIGDKGHEEVEAIKSISENAIIINSIDDVSKLPKIIKAGVVIQSTQSISFVSDIIKELTKIVEDLRVINTICQPTRNRQAQVMELAKENDVVLIVGSKSSANTKRLYEISKKINDRTYFVTNKDDIKLELIENAESIGISSGASTPDFIIKEIVSKIENF
ncbi:MAG: 4-hydroxy-3-methylbut-2-enyl diphosphate reductase [Candidatus Marinimicrobia bacterium]|nr:4-hydroxy-3-methylbut-2-enyl diphosphate reductase [Candidatus Neomarinimicrobiota bacterium]